MDPEKKCGKNSVGSAPSGSPCGAGATVASLFLQLLHVLGILQNLKWGYSTAPLEIQTADGLFGVLFPCLSLSCPFLEPKQGLNCRSWDDPATRANQELLMS